MPARSRAVCRAGQCVCSAVGADAQVGMRARSATARCKDQRAADISCCRTRVKKHRTRARTAAIVRELMSAPKAYGRHPPDDEHVPVRENKATFGDARAH